MIPNQVIACGKSHPTANIDVFSPDTDVLILLMHLVASGYLGVNVNLKLITGGKGKRKKVIDIVERVCLIGPKKSQGLLGFHNFTGADWGGKFVGISKKTWTDVYMRLDENSDVVKAFCMLGEDTVPDKLVDNELPSEVRSLEKFTCSVYSKQGP